MAEADPNRLFLQIIGVGYKMGFTRVAWNKATDSVIYKHSGIRLFWETVQMGLILGYEVFMCYQLLVTASAVNVGNADKIQIRYATLAWILLTFNPTICLSSGKEYARLVNGLRSHVKANAVPGETRQIIRTGSVEI